MLRRLRRRRRLWAALCAGLAVVPVVAGGQVALSADGSMLVPPPEPNLREALPPDPATVHAALVLAQSGQIADLAPEPYRKLVVLAANRHRVDPRLVAALITVETHWNGGLVGLHGERGLMQILPETGAFLAKEAGLTHFDLSDPETNVELGIRYVERLLQEYGTVERALAAYNGGPVAVLNAASNVYARKVLDTYAGTAVLPPVSWHRPLIMPLAS